MGAISEFLHEREIMKEAKQYQKILHMESYRDIYGNELNASEEQMKFLLRNFELDTLQRMFKRKPAYIMLDNHYIELFFVHSLSTDDMCIVFNNIELEGPDEDEQAAITIDKKGKLIDQYLGDIKYDYNSEDQTILI